MIQLLRSIRLKELLKTSSNLVPGNAAVDVDIWKNFVRYNNIAKDMEIIEKRI